MNCPRCNNPLPQGAAVCHVCGTPIQYVQPQPQPQPQQYAQPQPQPQPQQYAQPQYDGQQYYQQQYYQQQYYQAPPQPQEPSKMANFGPAFKGIFSKNIIETIKSATKSTGLEWLIFFAMSTVSFALGFTVNMCQMTDMAISRFPFFKMFAVNLFAGAAIFMLTVLAIRIISGIGSKEKIAFTSVLNMVGTATVPLSIVYTFNILLGAVFFALVPLFSITALFLTVVLLFEGTKELNQRDNDPFFAFAIALLVLVINAVLVTLLFNSIGVANELSYWFNMLARFF